MKVGHTNVNELLNDDYIERFPQFLKMKWFLDLLDAGILNYKLSLMKHF